MSQAALSGGKSLGGGGLLHGGDFCRGDPRFPTPLYETLTLRPQKSALSSSPCNRSRIPDYIIGNALKLYYLSTVVPV